MTEFSSVVERQRQMLAAEAWATEIASVHVHGFDSMWYDNHPEDTEGSKMVTDIEYNCGRIERQQGGKFVRNFGKELRGDALLDAYLKG
tara:strand:+ start:1054 stop:1320 length:267 start_codon:yes stop_codon:yes gene_type:complete